MYSVLRMRAGECTFSACASSRSLPRLLSLSPNPIVCISCCLPPALVPTGSFPPLTCPLFPLLLGSLCRCRVMTRGMVEDYISLRREMFLDVCAKRGLRTGREGGRVGGRIPCIG
jgi:hypothetical protein